MRKAMIAAVLVIAIFLAPVSAQQQIDYEYTPPGDATVEDLGRVYNANLDSVPDFLTPNGEDAVVIISIFEETDMVVSGTGIFSDADQYVLHLNKDGRVVGADDVDTIPDELPRNRIVVITSAATIDAIITADRPAEVAEKAYRSGRLRLEAEGDNYAVRAFLWVADLYYEVYGLWFSRFY